MNELREAPLPFYLGVRTERALGWRERRRRKRLMRRYLRAKREAEARRGK